MSLASMTMEEPKQDSLPPQVGPKQTNGDKPRPKKKNNRSKKNLQHSQSSQPSSPSLNSVPSTPMSSKSTTVADEETMSTASFGSSKSSRRRRAPAGGRKNRSKQHIAQQQQQDALNGGPATQPPLEDITEKELYGTGEDTANTNGPEPELQPQSHPQQEQKSEQKSEQKPEKEQGQQNKQTGTGIRKFNLRRSDPKGGLPLGVKTQVKNKEERAPTQSKCTHCGQSKPASSEAQTTSQPETQSRMPRISLKQKTPDQKQGPEGEQEGDKKDGQGKEFSIKLDLNLELEIALKAKVKGEVMITFME